MFSSFRVQGLPNTKGNTKPHESGIRYARTCGSSRIYHVYIYIYI